MVVPGLRIRSDGLGPGRRLGGGWLAAYATHRGMYVGPSLYEFVGCLVVVSTATEKIFVNPRGEATEDRASGRFG